MENIKIFDIKIDLINSIGINKEILNLCRENKKEAVANVNINAMNIAFENEKMKNFLNNAHINFIDGDGVNLGAKLLGLKTGSKVTYDWWIWELAKFSQDNNLSWYILGAKENSVSTAVKKLNSAFPDLQIKGYHNGYFNKKNFENEKVVEEINNLKPNILLMAMGMPTQEEWLIDNWDKLNINVALTGGAVVDYISGEFKSTPEIFRKLKSEWFYRFLQRPKYLLKRYFLGNPLFIYRCIVERFI
ncbi:MAG TPA: WecB/TagA/CpsF family glycosyltransferase [Ignavibacteriaceae bacterium]|nr:WecB/TagA/CpsF family glycosyltransferase [Ignavibacteriaceae bacterium]